MIKKGQTLVADNGYYLTQRLRKAEDKPRLLSTVYLCEGSSPEYYKEVTIEEGERMLKEWEEKYLFPEEPVFI